MDCIWHTELTRLDRFVAWLVQQQHRRVIGRVIHAVLRVRGTDIARSVRIRSLLRLRHSGIGVVVHPHTQLGCNVTLFQNVTIGRADVWHPIETRFDMVIGDEVIICSGAVILGGEGTRTIGEGAIIGANAVLSQDAGPWEIWAGVPARCIGHRTDGRT